MCVSMYMFQGCAYSSHPSMSCMAGMSGVYVCVSYGEVIKFSIVVCSLLFATVNLLFVYCSRIVQFRDMMCFRGVCVPGVSPGPVWLG